MNEVVFFLEEESARALLQKIFPLLVPAERGIDSRFVVFEGKQDLEKQLVKRLRGYMNANARFIVLRDQDRDDCRVIKRSLADLCASAGRPTSVIRIACHELEAFYLGDLRAVETGLQIDGLARHQTKARFR